MQQEMTISSGVISIDDGGSSTCVVTKDVSEMFPSVKGLYGKRTLTELHGKDDYIVEYEGKVYAMGSLAKYDCKYPIQMHSNSKQNLFFDLSVLVAIHQYGYTNNYVIVDVPITMHSEKEKFGRIARLLGEKRITVNGIEKKFNIMDVKVAPETAVAFWIKQAEGKSRYLDLGSRTIGFATALKEGENVRFIDTESGTINGKGLEALGDDYEPKALADLVCGRLLSVWNARDKVNLIGGGALDDELVECIREHFPNLVIVENPKMANAKGMYLLGNSLRYILIGRRMVMTWYKSEEEVDALIADMVARTKSTHITQSVSFNKKSPRQMRWLKLALMSSASFGGLVKEMFSEKFADIDVEPTEIEQVANPAPPKPVVTMVDTPPVKKNVVKNVKVAIIKKESETISENATNFGNFV